MDARLNLRREMVRGQRDGERNAARIRFVRKPAVGHSAYSTSRVRIRRSLG